MLNRKGLVLISGTIVMCLFVVCWHQQATWRSWYYARQLSSAHAEKRLDVAVRLEHLGLAGSQAAVNLLRSPRERACQNAAFGLEYMLKQWSSTDPRYEATLQYLADTCAGFSPLGQRELLFLLQQLLAEQKELAVGQVLIASRLLSQIGAQAETRLAALEVSAQLLQIWCSSPTPEANSQDQTRSNLNGFPEALLKQVKAWVVAGLKDENAAVRSASVQLAAFPRLNALELLPPLLVGARADVSPEVRYLAILALGAEEGLLSTDQICRFLNDEASVVRVSAERVLRARGLGDTQVKLGKLMYHSDPAARAGLAALIGEHPELDSLVWLERLSRDPIPAVRAAAARAMDQQQDQRVLTLLGHLAAEDGDLTVQEIARFFWERHPTAGPAK
jgi:hypothetical protein